VMRFLNTLREVMILSNVGIFFFDKLSGYYLLKKDFDQMGWC
jgi:hypothetical protein